MRGLKAIVIVAVAALVALSVTGVALAQGGPAGQAPGLADHPGQRPGLRGYAVMGEVTKVEGSTITLKLPNSATLVVGVTADTTYRKPGQDTASRADVIEGARIAVMANKVGDVLTARQVTIMPPPPPAPFHVQGKVTTVNGNTITITDKDGKIITLTLPAGATGVSVDDQVNIIIGRPFPKGQGHPEFKGKPAPKTQQQSLRQPSLKGDSKVDAS
ncbi:MAG: hypothetical protein HY687_05940 [Chloroflexi bacterium]|nr:hypothetical protein [Chloroflexota bacterium]